MSISFMPYIYDAASKTWRIPASCATDDDRFCVNMCNSNALDVLEQIGFPDMSVSDEPIAIERFLDRITTALRKSIDRPSPAIETRTTRIDCGMAIIIGGRSEGYVGKRLHQIALMARQSRNVGATHIGWN